jgi:hypothetical protein
MIKDVITRSISTVGVMDVQHLLSMRRGAFQFSGKWKEKVKALPESGMGYTVVRVTLLNGHVFEQAIIGSGFLSRIRGLADIPFQEEDIAEIVPTHERWDWTEKP